MANTLLGTDRRVMPLSFLQSFGLFIALVNRENNSLLPIRCN